MSYDPPKPATGVVIYGASDDLIEVDGEVRDEFSAWHDSDAGEYVPITVSDGTRAAVRFDEDGVWRIAILTAGTGNPRVDVHPLDEEDDAGRYTDVLTIDGPITWVRAGEAEVQA